MSHYSVKAQYAMHASG